MQDLDVILAGRKRHHRQIMEAQGMEEGEDEGKERQAILKLREWLVLAKGLDEISLPKQAELEGGGRGSRGDTHCNWKRTQNQEEAKAKLRMKPKKKTKAIRLRKDVSDVWVEKIRGGLCCVKKTSKTKQR